MPLSAIQNYIEYLPKRQAETRMMQGEAASVPHMTEDRHDEWVREINEHLIEAKPVAPSKLASIGVKVVRVRNNE